MAELEDLHRAFLQAFMKCGIMRAKEVKRQFNNICQQYNIEVENENNQLLEAIITINNEIKDLHLEIKKAVGEETGSHFYALVNGIESDITRLSSIYTLPECEYLKKLIEAIVEDVDGTVSSRVALNLTDTLENVKLTKSDAQSFLQRLEEDKWLLMEDGRVSLATRCLLEMESYIRDQCDSVEDCNMCRKLCVKGLYCPQCNCKLHRHCARVFFKKQDVPRCPNKECGALWTADNDTSQEEPSQTQSQSEDTSTRKRSRRHQAR